MTKPLAISEADVKRAHGAVVKARSELLMKQPFFGALALRLKPTVSPSEEFCNTAAVDGKHLFFHPPFINGLSKAEMVGLIAHEVLHCVFDHMSRQQFRDNSIWNVACDYTINQHLLDNEFILPQGGIFDTEGKYKGWNAETVYNDLSNGDSPPPPCEWGGVLPCPAGTDVGGLAADWEIAVRAAVQTAKAAGKMPGNITELIDELLTPVVDWRSILWQFATSLDRSDYNWSRPNRAYISEDIYLPSLRNETLGPIIVVIDTSGSVNDKLLQQFWSEIVDIAKHQRPEKLVVIQCDYNVQKTEEIDIDNAGTEKFEILGRGGTRFSPAFDEAISKYPDAEALIYLTDMECTDYGTAPPYPVIWMSTEKKWNEPPFGTVTYMALDD